MAQADVEIVNDALAAIGGFTIPSFLAPGPPGVNVERIYRAQLRFLVGSYPWHFANGFAALTRETADLKILWAYRYRMPNNRLAPPTAYYDQPDSKRRPFTDYELGDDGVLTNAERLWCSYRRLPPAQHWPSYFVELLRLACMAEFAMAVREDRSLRKELRIELFGAPQYMGQGGQWALATSIDATLAPTQSMAATGDPVLDHRLSGAGFHYSHEEWS